MKTLNTLWEMCQSIGTIDLPVWFCSPDAPWRGPLRDGDLEALRQAALPLVALLALPLENPHG